MIIKLVFTANIFNKICRIRDQDLIAKVKAEAIKREGKIFAIAGSWHLRKEGKSVIDAFHDVPCAVIIPKVSKLGKQNVKNGLLNVKKYGNAASFYDIRDI